MAREYILSARPLYPDGSSGGVVAEVTSERVPTALSLMAAHLTNNWWPPEDHPDDGLVPDAIDLTLSWREGGP